MKYPVLLLAAGSWLGAVWAEWEPDIRLTANPAASLTPRNSEHAVAAGPERLVHSVFWDDRSGNNEIYYLRSSDQGRSWFPEVRLTEDTARSWTPSIAIAESVIHLVWFDTRDGPNGEIYYKRSTDCGTHWQADVRLSEDTAKSEVPAVAAAGQCVHVVWRDNRESRSSWEIYYRRSADAGQTWSEEVRLTAVPGIKWNPAVAVVESLVHLVWADNRDGNWEIYYKRSTDAGLNWEADVRLTENIFAQQWPCVVAVNSLVIVAWTDGEDVDGELDCRSSTDGGATWLPPRRITAGGAEPGMWAPALAISGELVHAVWPDGRAGNLEIYYSRSTDRGQTWEEEERLTEEPAVSNYPSVAARDSVVHVIWSDYRDGNYEVYYKRNPTGNVGVGEGSISDAPHRRPGAAIVRGVLNLGRQVAAHSPRQELLDATGQKVLELRPGPNDVRHLPSGIYFLTMAGSGQRPALTKVVVTR